MYVTIITVEEPIWNNIMIIEVTVKQDELDDMGVDELELEQCILEDIDNGVSGTDYSGFNVSVTVLR